MATTYMPLLDHNSTPQLFNGVSRQSASKLCTLKLYAELGLNSTLISYQHFTGLPLVPSHISEKIYKIFVPNSIY